MIGLIASVVLGCVMCAAGASKIVMGKRWSVEAASMGAPRFVIPFVPWIEVVTGGLLIAQWQRRLTALAIAGLLITFSALIVKNLATGNRPRCACFGTWAARPLSWVHVLRNCFLLALAVTAWV